MYKHLEMTGSLSPIQATIYMATPSGIPIKVGILAFSSLPRIGETFSCEQLVRSNKDIADKADVTDDVFDMEVLEILYRPNPDGDGMVPVILADKPRRYMPELIA